MKKIIKAFWTRKRTLGKAGRNNKSAYLGITVGISTALTVAIELFPLHLVTRSRASGATYRPKSSSVEGNTIN